MEGIDNEMPRFAKRPENHDLKKVKQVHDSNDLRSEVAKYLQDKLAKKLNVSSIKVPWSKMEAKDILNWPENVDFRTVDLININDLKRLHNLIKEDKLDFAPVFLHQLKLDREINWTRYRNQFRSQIVRYFGDKLATKLNLSSRRVPWSQIKAKDIINWPSGLEFKAIKKMPLNDLKKLHELAVEDKLDFSPEFLRRRGVQSSKNI